MRPQDRKQRIQRNRAIAVQLVMLMAGIGIGTYFVMQAVSSDVERGLDIFAAFTCYGIAAFYGWLQVRRWRREKRIKQILAEKAKRKRSGSG